MRVGFTVSASYVQSVDACCHSPTFSQVAIVVLKVTSVQLRSSAWFLLAGEAVYSRSGRRTIGRMKSNIMLLNQIGKPLTGLEDRPDQLDLYHHD